MPARGYPPLRSNHAVNQLDQLKRHTTVVADTGNFKQLAQYTPQDATTNPSLILKAVQQPDYYALLTPALDAAAARQMDLPAVHYDEGAFRWALNEDAMASDKLAEGIRAFAADAVKLERLIEGLRK